jgi:hypothetical protein
MKKRSRKSGTGNTKSSQRIPHELAAVVGVGPLTREQLVNRLSWYVQQNGLQEDATRIHVARDANLRSLFRREKTVPFVYLVARVAEILRIDTAREQASGGDIAGDACPICASNEGCAHLVVRMDMSSVRIRAGSFLEVKEEALEVLNKAVMGYLEARRAGTNDRPKGSERPSFSLEMLIDQVDDAVEDLAGDDGIHACGRHLLNYLDDIFLELDDRERTTYEVDDHPGVSTTYWCFWARDAKKAARQALSLILADAKALHG